MHAFEFLRATSVAEAAQFLETHPDAKLLAGGQTLIPTLKNRLAQPSHLIDLSRIADLRGIKVADGQVSVGAMTRQAEVAAHAGVHAAAPMLATLARGVADMQVRNRSTVGGSIANNDPAADWPAAVLALGATLVTNKREITAEDFFTGMFSTALEADELLLRVVLPVPKRAAYAKFHHPASGYAMAGVCVAETASGVRVAVTGAGMSGVFRWIEAEAALTEQMSASALAKLNVAEDQCLSDLHAPAAYRAHLVKVMAEKALGELA